MGIKLSQMGRNIIASRKVRPDVFLLGRKLGRKTPPIRLLSRRNILRRWDYAASIRPIGILPRS